MRLGFAYLDGFGPNWFDSTGDLREGKKNSALANTYNPGHNRSAIANARAELQ
jgi:hypothetical protein